MKAVSLHLIEINKRYKDIAKFIKPLIKAAVIRVSPSDSEPKISAKTPLSKAATEKIKKNSKMLAELNGQFSALSNMVLNLNTQFKSSDVNPTLITSLTKSITTLQAQIRKSLVDTHSAASVIGASYASDKSKEYTKRIVLFLNKKFESKGTVSVSSGIHSGEPCITHFIKYENIKNDKGEVEPSITIAISEYKGQHWINPNIVRARAVGNFPLGFQLAEDDKTAQKQMERYIQEQMIVDSQLSTISPKLVPIKPEQINFNNNLVRNARFEEHTILVNLVTSIPVVSTVDIDPQGIKVALLPVVSSEELAKYAIAALVRSLGPILKECKETVTPLLKKDGKFWKVSIPLNMNNKLIKKKLRDIKTVLETTKLNLTRSPEIAEAVAQEIYKSIHTAMTADKRTRDRIVYEIKDTSKNWQIIYKFTTGDKYTGRTLTNDESEKLKSVFDESEVEAIKKALNSLPGKE